MMKSVCDARPLRSIGWAALLAAAALSPGPVFAQFHAPQGFGGHITDDQLKQVPGDMAPPPAAASPSLPVRHTRNALRASGRIPTNVELVSLFRSGLLDLSDHFTKERMIEDNRKVIQSFDPDPQNPSNVDLDAAFEGFGTLPFSDKMLANRRAALANYARTAIVTVRSKALLEGNWVVMIVSRARGNDVTETDKMIVVRDGAFWVARFPNAGLMPG